MKILAQNYRNGNLEMLEVPMFTNPKGLLIETKASIVSIGTEKAMIDVAKKSLLGKALARPDWIKRVIDKIQTEGLMEAWRQSKARLDTPVPLGYSCSGIVREVNISGCDFRIGDRVACSGSGFASHADWNVIPPNLCAKIPDNVSFDDAAYVVLGSIAMESVRVANIEFGHKVGVIGLGLLGQIAVQILKAAGCHVIGIDVSAKKCELALINGIEKVAVADKDDPVAIAKEFSNFEGLDSVIILASVASDIPLIQAANMCRERGKIVACGLVNLNIPRQIFYEKELDFVVSRAWGPGMYDPDFELRNIKYPVAYARWTANRNMDEFLKMLSLGSVKMNHITTHKFQFEKALEAYNMILIGKEPAIGVVLQYNQESEADSKKLETKIWNRPKQDNSLKKEDETGIGLIGAGLFARGTLLPAIKKINNVRNLGVATSSGISAEHIANNFNFSFSTTDYKEILKDINIDIVFILTRHNSHAKFACEAIKAGKAVFLEKPLCINENELKNIIDTYSSLVTENSSPFLMVGFNRRFAPTTIRCIEFFKQSRASTVVQIRCNAGYIPKEIWVHKQDEGGGRIIGEVCHFIDLAQAITGGLPKKVFASCVENEGLRDNLTLSLKMNNGASVSIAYASCGDKTFPREEVQVFGGGCVCVIDNFKNIQFYSSGKKKNIKSLNVDRGHLGELEATFDALKYNKPCPIDFKSIVATTITTFAIEESITKGESVEIDLKKWGI